MKQTDIAEILGIKQAVCFRYERGFQIIPIDLLVFTDYYNISTDYIFGRTNNPEIFE